MQFSIIQRAEWYPDYYPQLVDLIKNFIGTPHTDTIIIYVPAIEKKLKIKFSFFP
jgi:hypothetical protein